VIREPAARRLFRISITSYGTAQSQPRAYAAAFAQSRLEELSQDKNFLRELKQVFEEFEKYLGRHDTYGKAGAGSAIKNPIAYFSAEFGFHESIPNYSGGLGILAGDHCKSASDLDLNFVAIGLLYRHGYFRQQIDKDGVQQAINLNQNFYHLPIREVRRGETKFVISVRILDREVFARVWELRVGRVNVYLLDTDIPENKAEDRLITAELYAATSDRSSGIMPWIGSGAHCARIHRRLRERALTFHAGALSGAGKKPISFALQG
jgi:starch phosphorylase